MKSIESFFQEYATASTNANAAEVAKFYAENFIAATKEQSSTFRNDEKFLEWLTGIFQFNKEAGLQKMEVKAIKHIAIGKYFMEATVTWAAVFTKKPEKEINFDIHYILNHSDETFKIILYISEDDQEALMKKEGLL